MTPVRPNFKQPPLVEQVITLIFEEFAQFSVGDYGLFWERIRSDFPTCTTQSPLEPLIESFGDFSPAGVKFRLVGHDVLPRCIYRSSDGGELIQLQRDRFTFNWCYVEGSTYPHFEATLCRYRELLHKFSEFVESRGWGPPVVRQCEVTNVNIVEVKQFGSSFAEAHNAFRLPELTALMKGMRQENSTILTQFSIIDEDGNGRPVGRLHTNLAPARSEESGELAWRFELTARSVPLSQQIDVDSFFAIARSAINSAFIASTTQFAHKIWERTDA